MSEIGFHFVSVKYIKNFDQVKGGSAYFPKKLNLIFQNQTAKWK